MNRQGKYRPSNGTEGADFIDYWCGNCERDRGFRENPDSGTGCEIIASTMIYEIDHPYYPKEWCYVDGKPCCTAFIEEGGQIRKRCENTRDMFGVTE